MQTRGNCSNTYKLKDTLSRSKGLTLPLGLQGESLFTSNPEMFVETIAAESHQARSDW